MKIKDKILKELNKVERKGIDNYIDMLKRTDFFEAPASRNHHLNYKGGLAEHSYNVLKTYRNLRYKYGLDNESSEYYIPEESMILEAIGHDNCKIGLYEKDNKEWSAKQKSYLISLFERYADKIAEYGVVLDEDEEGNIKDLSSNYASDLISWILEISSGKEVAPPERKDSWIHENNFPVGHGEKSIILMQRFIKLRKREMLAIRWHMSAFEEGVFNGYKSMDFNKARDLFPDVQMIQMADYEASFIEDYNLEVKK